jgi:CheY-like chemotaxis protein
MSRESYKLLVVEDESNVRHLMSEIFRSLGHEVRSAEDGFSALKEIQRSTPDIILSDLNMPGMSGFELLSVLRRRLPKIYVIATSGAYSGPGVPLGIAADAFYEKASGISALLKLVSSAAADDAVPARKNAAIAPIWICQERGESSLVINCPECMRNTSRPVEDSILTIHQTSCLFCGSVIPYVVIPATDTAGSHANLPDLRPIAS